jgi:hypothetical protein
MPIQLRSRDPCLVKRVWVDKEKFFVTKRFYKDRRGIKVDDESGRFKDDIPPTRSSSTSLGART